jgi:hypothetical protein
MTEFKIVHNVQTGEITTEPLTNEEVSQRQLLAVKENEISQAKAALLEKLGITEEEAKLLLS